MSPSRIDWLKLDELTSLSEYALQSQSGQSMAKQFSLYLRSKALSMFRRIIYLAAAIFILILGHQPRKRRFGAGPEESSLCSSLTKSTVNYSKSKSHVAIAHLNVRSLICREKFNLVCETVRNYDYDIFTISETWLNPSTSDAIVIEVLHSSHVAWQEQ